MTEFLNKVKDAFNSIPDVVVGILMLALAFVVAVIAKSIFIKILSKTKLCKKINETAGEDGKKAPGFQAIEIVGKLIFLIIFLLFLPASLEKFGMNGITAPITNLVDSFVGYVPNIIACILILLIGFFIANLVRQIITAGLNLAKFDKLKEKLTKGKLNVDLGKIIATIAYIFIVVVVVICALNILGIEAISAPATGMLNSIIDVIPQIIVAVVMLAIGVFLSNIVGSFISSILESFNVDKKVNEWLSGDKKETKPIFFEKIITSIIKTVIIILFAVEAIKTLNFSILAGVGTSVIGFLPSALIAVIVGLIAFVVCKLVDTKLPIESNLLKNIIKVVVVVATIFIALSQLNIAPTIVNTTFIFVVGALAVVVAIAVGIGGIPFVRDLLSKVKFGKNDKDDK